MSSRSFRQWLLGIEDRRYVVSSTSYPARVHRVKNNLRFTLNDHTLIEVACSKVATWDAADLIGEFETILSSKFGLNHLAWDVADLDRYLKSLQ